MATAKACISSSNECQFMETTYVQWNGRKTRAVF